MPTTDQKSDLLFKKYLGKGSSGTSSFYFNEPLDGRNAVFPIQIWQDQSLIPTTAASVDGIVQQVVNLVLTQIPGQPFAFYHADLKNAIPFNYDFNGSYVPVLRRSDNSVIAFGENDWVVDIDTGMVTFYAGLPTGVSDTTPPKITFWKYIGAKGFPTGSATASWAGTSSYAESASYAITSSYTDWANLASSSYNSIYSTNAINATFAQTATNAGHATVADTSTTASHALYAKTSSYGFYAVSATSATNAGHATNATFADTASYAYYAQVTLGTASYAFEAVHAASADVATYTPNAGHADTATTASYAYYAQVTLGTASLAFWAETSSNAIRAYNADHATTASHAMFSEYALSASHALQAQHTYGTASYSNRGDFAFYAAEAGHTPNADHATTASFALYAEIALGTASYALEANHAVTANSATTAGSSNTSFSSVSASYAYYAQVALGTASFALEAAHANWADYATSAGSTPYATTASHGLFSEYALSASHALQAQHTYGTSSYANRSDFAFNSGHATTADFAPNATTASYAHFAQVVYGTSSFALSSDTASYLDMAGGTASYAMEAKHAARASLADSATLATRASNADHADVADAALNALNAAFATEAGWATNATSSISTSFAITALSASVSFVSDTASFSLYALTASYFDGSASGSVINIGNPTDGYYGSGSMGNIAGIASGDKIEDAIDKLDYILDKLVPARPPGLNTKTLILVSSYTARLAGTNVSYANVTDIQTPSFQLAGGTTVSNSFADGNNGTLSAKIDGVVVGSKALSPSDDTGTFGGLQITLDTDYYLGQSGKAGFWNSLVANATAQSTIDDNLIHTASLSHTTTGESIPYYFYIDNPSTPSFIGATATPTGMSYVSGVPAFVGGVNGAAIQFSATGSFGFTWRFYNSIRVFGGSGTGISAGNFTLPNSPSAGSLMSGSMTSNIVGGSTSENANYTITAYNSKGGTATSTISNTRYRLDSTTDTSNRVSSGIGQYPSVYGSAFVSSDTLVGTEELQMLNGQYRYPTGNYTGSLPVAGPDYSSVNVGSYNNMRWVTFNLGTVSAASNITLSFSNTTNFTGGGLPMSNFALYARIVGSTPTNGWIDGNTAYSGVGNPTNNGDLALVVASSTTTSKVLTFGTATKTGTVYVRVGIPVGDNKRFTNITMTSA